MSSIEYINSTVISSTTNTITFSNIPQYYQDLTITSLYSTSLSTSTNTMIRFNGDNSANYSYVTLWGRTSSNSVGGNTEANTVNSYVDYYSGPISGGVLSTSQIDIFSYSNTNTFKTLLSQSGRSDSGGTGGNDMLCVLWRSASAINSITLFLVSGNFSNGSTFTLWGVR